MNCFFALGLKVLGSQLIGKLKPSTRLSQEKPNVVWRRAPCQISHLPASRKGSSPVSEIQLSDHFDVETLRERLLKMTDTELPYVQGEKSWWAQESAAVHRKQFATGSGLR